MEDSVRITTDKKSWLNRTEFEDTVVPNRRARFASEFIARWGCVAAIPDGEDSSGRQKLRLPTPVELVDRAIETAETLNTRMIALGWLVEVPKPVNEAEGT